MFWHSANSYPSSEINLFQRQCQIGDDFAKKKQQQFFSFVFPFQIPIPADISLRTGHLPPAEFKVKVSSFQQIQESIKLTPPSRRHSQCHSTAELEAHGACSSLAQSKQPIAISCMPRRGQP